MSDEQRSYFRIDDTLKLSWRPVATGDVQSDAEMDNELRDINEQLSGLISVAFQESPVIGEAMGLLNRKLDLLTIEKGGRDVAFQPTRVNLSGAGIGFAWPSPAEPATEIDVTLILKPSNVSVTVRSEVIHCSKSNHEHEDFWIQCAFKEGQDIVTEQIIQHVNARQMELIAAQRRRQQLYSALRDD
ncbi:MAG: hypothetical protein RLZZ602_2119 [Pseudomonadota bacterium]